MATIASNVTWGSSPKIYFDFSYEKKREGSTQYYKITVSCDPLTGSSYFGYPIYLRIKLDGTTAATKTLKSASPSQWSSAKTYTTDWLEVPNKTTGTTSLAIRIYSGSGSSRDKTYNYSLDIDPAASKISATDANIESTSTISIKKYDAGFYTKVYYQAAGQSSKTLIFASETDTSYGWTVPSSLYSLIPNDKEIEITLSCATYSEGTLIGTETCTMTATTAASKCNPAVSVIAVDTNTNTVALTGNNKKIVKGFSDVAATVTAKAYNSASISSVSVTCGSAKKTGTSVTFSKAESATIKATATDSRGYSNSATASGLTLINYIVPTIVATISRESPTSDTVNISATGKWFNGSFGSVTNTLKVQVRYKPKNQTSYEDTDEYVDMIVTTSGNTYSASVSLTGLDYTQAYSIRIRVSDAIHVYDGPLAAPVYKNTEISKGIPVFDWGEEDFNFNVPVTINGSPLFTVLHPVGSVCITSENEAPEAGSWALLDKEFIPIHGSFDDDSYFTLGSASSCTFAFSRAHHTIYTRFLFTPTVDLSDSGVTIGTVDISKLGITDFTYSKYAVGYSDGGNGVFMCELESTGALIIADVIGEGTTIPAGANCWVEFTHVVRHGSMLDEACNRFYWKRTA